jgi:hypothetical protein
MHASMRGSAVHEKGPAQFRRTLMPFKLESIRLESSRPKTRLWSIKCCCVGSKCGFRSSSEHKVQAGLFSLVADKTTRVAIGAIDH